VRISVGSDESTELTQAILKHLQSLGYDLQLHGPIAGDTQHWPVVARKVAEDVAQGSAEQGLLFCWTGTGVSIAANKVPGIRAALCEDAETARGARLWNDANVLCLSLRSASIPKTKEILQTWFETEYVPNPEDDASVAEVAEIERNYSVPKASEDRSE
jgi:ribose 5-phosphate isomerase B